MCYDMFSISFVPHNSKIFLMTSLHHLSSYVLNMIRVLSWNRMQIERNTFFCLLPRSSLRRRCDKGCIASHYTKFTHKSKHTCDKRVCFEWRSTTHTHTLTIILFHSIPFRSALEVRDRASELQFKPEWRCRITFLPPFIVVCGAFASDDVVVTHMVPLYCNLVVLQVRRLHCVLAYGYVNRFVAILWMGKLVQ